MGTYFKEHLEELIFNEGELDKFGIREHELGDSDKLLDFYFKTGHLGFMRLYSDAILPWGHYDDLDLYQGLRKIFEYTATISGEKNCKKFFRYLRDQLFEAGYHNIDATLRMHFPTMAPELRG